VTARSARLHPSSLLLDRSERLAPCPSLDRSGEPAIGPSVTEPHRGAVCPALPTGAARVLILHVRPGAAPAGRWRVLFAQVRQSAKSRSACWLTNQIQLIIRGREAVFTPVAAWSVSLRAILRSRLATEGA